MNVIDFEASLTCSWANSRRFAELGELLAHDRGPGVEPGEHHAQRAHTNRGEIPGPGTPRRLGGLGRFGRPLVGEPRFRLGLLQALLGVFDLPREQRGLRLGGLQSRGRGLRRLAQGVRQGERVRTGTEPWPRFHFGGERGAIPLRVRELVARIELALVGRRDDQLEE